MSAHARLGASGSKRWMECPGSVRLAEEFGVKDEGSVWARAGTAAHAVAEKCLLNGLDPEFYVGQKIEGIKVDRDMAAAVRVYVDKVRMVGGDDISEDNVEVRVDLSDLNPPEEMFGTVDFGDLQQDHLWIIDYKHGQGVAVEAEENPQMLYYALGYVLKKRVKPKKITVVIVQPRCAHPDGVVRDWTFSWERLVSFKHDLMAAAEATQEPDAPLAVGDWCQFCPAKARCPAQYSTAVEIAQNEFEVITEDVLPAPELLDESDLLAVLDKADIVIDWLKRVKEFTQHRLEDRLEVPGWKLIEKRANRKWKDEDDVIKACLELEGVEESDLRAAAKILSPAQMEKKLATFGHDLPDGLWDRTPTGYNMVRDTDPRPAASLQLSAEDEFTATA